MAHTDKDRPYWVRIRDYNIIQHDHTRGVCIVDDDRRNRWAAWRHHWRNCAKRVRVEWECTKADPYRPRRWHYSWMYGGIYRDNDLCWDWACGCAIPDSWKREPHACTARVRTQCLGHVSIETHAEIPCVCDDKPEPATCFPEEPSSWRYSCFGGGGVPHDYVRARWHGPERRREREDLRDAARLYNAGEDLEDFDFVNRQARSSARWLYH